jgi:hypothetical protein
MFRSANLFSQFVTYLPIFFFVIGKLMNIFSRKNVRMKVLFTSAKGSLVFLGGIIMFHYSDHATY